MFQSGANKIVVQSIWKYCIVVTVDELCVGMEVADLVM